MADILDQIQQRQARARDQELAGAQRDVDWNATFGRMAPDNVLRGTRNMTALIANAVEKKMELAAQTSAEAQRIWINDQKFKAEQRMEPLKDARLKAQTAAAEARARAITAQELLATSRLEKEARGIEHTASAQWELDQLEGSSLPDAEKRAWLNTVRGRYPEMDKDTTKRHEALHERLNPTKPAPLTDEAAATRAGLIAGAQTKARNAAKPANGNFPAGASTTYSKSLGLISGNQELLKKASEADKPKIQAEITKNQEIVRSLESMHPKLRPTRGLEATAAASTPPASTTPAAPAFAPGAERVKDGVTYVRGNDGLWLPKR